MLALVVAPGIALADTTLGTNLSTTGTFTMTKTSATAAQFQNAGGTTIFMIDTTNSRAGIAYGSNLDTKFEVGGTASATNAIVSGAVQFAGNASVAYSRFGTGTTGHSLAAASDLLVTGLLEIDGNAFFDSKASISSNLQISGRFIADTAASHSFAGDLTATRAARVGTTGYQNTTFEVGGTASVGTNFTVGEISTATTSVTFKTNAAAKGTCLIMTDTAGTTRYLRLFGNTLTINTTACNQ